LTEGLLRILFVNQFYWPDAAATSQLLTDVTRALADEGHEVVVMCGQTGYATVDIMDQPPPVTIRRIWCAPYMKGKIGRALSYVSFLSGCLWGGLWVKKPDLIVTMTTPPVLSVVGAILQRKHRAKHYIWVMDLFPEALVDVGLFPAHSPLVRILHFISDWSYRKADGMIALGECMRRRLAERKIPAEKLHVAENWADGTEIFPIDRERTGPLRITYSGNLGLSHDLDTILSAIKALRDDERFHFCFIGGGQRQKAAQEICAAESVRNVSFRAYCPRTRLAESLSEMDIGLVTQRPTSAGSVVPSKVYGLMAAGKPILYIGPRTTTPFWIIERFRCGWQIDCEDATGLVALLNELEAHPEMVAAAGERAREAFLKYYDRPQGVARICSLLAPGIDRGMSPQRSDANAVTG
jgi:glycosyltransferase involved in cell wall biosynthesis